MNGAPAGARVFSDWMTTLLGTVNPNIFSIVSTSNSKSNTLVVRGTGAYPVVESITESTFPETTSHLVVMPATVATGNLLIMLFSNDGTTACATPAGWTSLAASGATADRFTIFTKVSDGTEGGTTVNVTTGATNEHAVAQVFRISGSYSNSLADIEIGSWVLGTVTNPDPPSLTASWGAGRNLFIAVCNTNMTDNAFEPAPFADPPTATQYRLMLAAAADPNTPVTNITSHSEGAAGGVLVRYERGVQRAVLGEPPAAGAMSVTLLNEDMARYALDAPAPGLALRLNKMVSSTWYPMAQANIDDPVHDLDGFRPIVRLQGFGSLAKLANRRVSTALYTNITTGTAIGHLLDAAGFPSVLRDLDTGVVTLRYWWCNDEDALTALQKLINSEGITAELYEQGDGTLRFRDRAARYTETRSTVTQSTLTSQGATPQLSDFQYITGGREVINYASHERIARHDDTATTVVWQDDNGNGDYIIAPNDTLVFIAVADEPFFDAIVPVLNVDYEVGLGSVVVTLERDSGQRTRITFTAGVNGATIGGAGANTGITLRATATLAPYTFVEESSVDAIASIVTYGLRAWTGEMSKELEWWDMRDNLDAVVTWKQAPRGRVRVRVSAHSSAAANLAVAARDIGDRVRITNQNHDFDGYGWIMRIEHEVHAPASLAEATGSLQVGAEYSTYECLLISVEAGSGGTGVSTTNPYDAINNEAYVTAVNAPYGWRPVFPDRIARRKRATWEGLAGFDPLPVP